MPLTNDQAELSRTERMKKLLTEQFSPKLVSLVDESARHEGHAGAAPGGETHYALKLVASAFEGKSRLERQRLVYHALREEFDTGLHALALDLKTPAEAEKTA
jgi:BolA family transcriptional regulator, general stress-responsive regulator